MWHWTILAFAGAAAQVWSALMVFHILLVRDLKHQIEREIDSLWTYARSWWPKLLVLMKNESHGSLRARLGEFGLDPETVLRADTHKSSFIRLIGAIKAHQIVSKHGLEPGVINEQALSAQEWQLKFEPIAERIEELEHENADTGTAFRLGLGAMIFNLLAIAISVLIGGHDSNENPWWPLKVELGVLLLANLVWLGVFATGVRRSLEHFKIASNHEQLSGQRFERSCEKKTQRPRRFRNLGPRKAG